MEPNDRANADAPPRTVREFLKQPLHPDTLDPDKDFFERNGARAGERSLAAGCGFLALLVGIGIAVALPIVGIPIAVAGALAVLGSLPSGSQLTADGEPLRTKRSSLVRTNRSSSRPPEVQVRRTASAPAASPPARASESGTPMHVCRRPTTSPPAFSATPPAEQRASTLRRFELDPLEHRSPEAELGRAFLYASAATVAGTCCFALTTPGRVAFTLSAWSTLLVFVLLPLAPAMFSTALMAQATPRAWPQPARLAVGALVSYAALFALMWVTSGDFPNLELLHTPRSWEQVLAGDQ